MDIIDYYNEKKWCDSCSSYVNFLMSVDDSYCVHCGSKVRLFNKEDLKNFTAALTKEKDQRKGRRAKAGEKKAS